MIPTTFIDSKPIPILNDSKPLPEYVIYFNNPVTVNRKLMTVLALAFQLPSIGVTAAEAAATNV